MDVLTGSLDDGAKEGGLIVILGFQAKERFLWVGVEPSVDSQPEGQRAPQRSGGPPTSLHQ